MKSPVLMIAGMLLGLIGLLSGIFFSSAFTPSAATYGLVCAVWFSVSAAILSRHFRIKPEIAG